MKKALPIILVFIALTNIVGFIPLYFSALQKIKGEVNLKLANGSDLQQIQVTDLEYNNPAVFSKSEENEFMYSGQMYDYKTVKKTAGGYIFSVIEDDKESNLVGFLKSSFGQSNQTEKSSKAPLANLLKNFSKDFVGCFSKPLLFSLSGNTYPILALAQGTRIGHFAGVQNPPD